MRVGIDAHTVGRRQTGNERFTVELASALARRADIEVLAYLDEGADWPADARPEPRLGRLRMRRPQLRIPLELPVRARRDQLDILQVAYVAPPLTGTPLVTVVHDVSFEDTPDMYRRRTRWRLKLGVRRAVGQSAAVVTGSRFTRDRLIDIYALDPSRVHHARYGVSEFWRPPSRAGAAALVAGLDLPPRIVLAVGTEQPRKNLDRLARAVAAVRQSGAGDLGLVIVGPTGGSGGEPWLRRLGFVSDETLRALYSIADAVAYVSLYEGFGLPVLEALGCGAAVVASSTTAVAEAAGDACVLVDPADEESIRNGLQSALTDEALRATLRARAPAQVARFTWDACAAQMVDIYRAVARRGAA